MGHGRAAAIREVRRQQERAWRRLIPSGRPSVDAEAIIEAALARAREREQSAQSDDRYVYADGFKYPLALERLRWARTRDVIQRVAPGPFEDARFLEMLARQAASVEIILCQEHTESPSARVQDLCGRLILGTLPSLTPTATTARVRNYSTLFLTAGLIDFLYQLAKFTVLSWKIERQEDGLTRTDGRPDTMDRTLAERPEILHHLLETYRAYLYEGRPRYEWAMAPPLEAHTPLRVLVNFNERFVLAHEYAHTLFDASSEDQPHGLSERDEESHADIMGFFLVNESGHVLDGLPPVVSSQGIFFVLAALETLRRALDLARFGEVREDSGFASHPPVTRRYALMTEVYRQQISDRDDDLSINGALTPAQSLMHLWRKLEGPLARAHAPDRPLHAMWV